MKLNLVPQLKFHFTYETEENKSEKSMKNVNSWS